MKKKHNAKVIWVLTYLGELQLLLCSLLSGGYKQLIPARVVKQHRDQIEAEMSAW